MKRDELGRTKTERLVDEARRERRNAIIWAAFAGFVVGMLGTLAVLDIIELWP